MYHHIDDGTPYSQQEKYQWDKEQLYVTSGSTNTSFVTVFARLDVYCGKRNMHGERERGRIEER